MKTLIAAFVASIMISCSSTVTPSEAPLPEYPVTSLLPASVTTYREYPVSIEGIEDVEIRPQVSGTLETLYIDEGAQVRAGDPLFKINDQPYRAAVANAEAQLHAAKGALQNAELEVEKLTTLYNNHVVSEYQLKTVKASAEVAFGNLEQASANVRTAQINLGYTIIKAPVSGYIGRLQKKRGTLVSPADAQALTILSDVHTIHAYFALGESEFVAFKAQYPGETLEDKLKQVPPVNLILNGTSLYEQAGKLDMIDGQFNQTTGAITFRAQFSNTKGLIRSGNTGKVRIPFVNTNTVVVPVSATTEMQDKLFVFIVSDSNKVKKQLITIKGKNNDGYLVQEGLKPGDRIVSDGIGTLQEGLTIQPRQTAPKATSSTL